MNRQRILFVDDEREILHSLQNVLRKDRLRWNTLFADSAEGALAIMREAPVDVIVTDMRMPIVDGAQLLAQVRRAHPGTSRLVLSGHADRELLLRALPVSHQYFGKPCDVSILRIAIERICELQQRVSHAGVRTFVGGIEALPFHVDTQRALQDLARGRETRVEDFVQLIEVEPALAAKVLQLVNSMYFMPGRPIVSIRDAVCRLGLDLLRTLVLETQVLTSEPRASHPDPGQAAVVRTARLARQLAVDPEHGEAAYSATLLRDIGKHVIALAEAMGLGPYRPEQCAPQTEIGAYLLALWGVPDSIVDAVAQAYEPTRAQRVAPQVLSAMRAAIAVVEAETRSVQ